MGGKSACYTQMIIVHLFCPAQLADINCISAGRFHKCPGYDTKQSDGEAPVLELWGNVRYPFIAIIPRVVAPARVLSMCQIELFDI